MAFLGAVARASVVGGLVVLAAPAGAISFRPVAHSGDVAPGAGGALFAEFGPAQIDAQGGVGFFAELSGPGIDEGGGFVLNDEGLWSEGTGSLGLVAREGDEAPGTGGEPWVNPIQIEGPDPSLREFVLSGSGQMAFDGALGPLVQSNVIGDFDDEGIWSGQSGSVELLVREGDVAPGTGGAVFTTFFDPAANDAGQLGFVAALDGFGPRQGNSLWTASGGQLDLVAERGTAAPGGGTFGSFGTPSLNEAGEVAFFSAASFGGPPLTSALFAGEAGSLRLVAKAGDDAPGTGGVPFAGFQAPRIDGAGGVTFVGFARPEGTVGGTEGVWTDASGTLENVALEGQAAPGAGGSLYREFDDLIVNEAGQIAFVAELVNPFVTDGIFGPDGAGGVTLYLRSGESLEGLGDATIGSSPQLSALSAHGELLILARLLEDGAAAGNALIFALDAENRIIVAAPGDVLDGRVVSTVFGADLNDSHQVSFVAEFTDGSFGVYVATVPEPSTLLLVLLGALAFGARGRTR